MVEINLVSSQVATVCTMTVDCSLISPWWWEGELGRDGPDRENYRGH